MWLGHPRVNGKVPGGHIARLGERVQDFAPRQPGRQGGRAICQKNGAARVASGWYARLAARRGLGFTQSDIAAVSISPLVVGLEETAAAKIEGGPSLRKELENAPWGETLPNGLRMACLLEPSAAEHRLGTLLKMRILIHNTGKEAVLFRARSWHHIGLKRRLRTGGGDRGRVSDTAHASAARDLPSRP